MKRLRSKPVPITQEAFQRAYHTKSEETLQINKLAVGQGLTSRCRWKHEKRTNVCGGRAFFRYATKLLNMTPEQATAMEHYPSFGTNNRPLIRSKGEVWQNPFQFPTR